MNSTNPRKKKRSPSPPGSKSFIECVTDLLPSAITKWWVGGSSSRSDPLQTDTPAASTDSSDDEQRDQVQPPSKRMKFSPRSINSLYSTETIPSPQEMEQSADNQFSQTNSRISGRPTYRRDLVSGSRADTPEHSLQNDTMYTSPTSQTNHTTNSTVERKSIFESTGIVKSDVITPKEETPQPSTSNTKRETRPNFMAAGSVFYPDRTRYGGASSPTVRKINTNNNQKIVLNVQKPRNDSDLSSATRRVMELLDSFVSPLSEARTIANIEKRALMHNSSYRLDTSRPSYSYRTQEMYVPSVASRLRIKQHKRLSDTTRIARQLIASHSSMPSYYSTPDEKPAQMPEKKQDKVTTKITTRVTKRNKGEETYEIAEPVQLPTAVLQIDKNNLPKFSINGEQKKDTACETTPTKTISTSTNTAYTSSIKSTSPVASSFSKTSDLVFTFSNPIVLYPDSQYTVASTDTSAVFSFDRKADAKTTKASSVCEPVNGTDSITTATSTPFPKLSVAKAAAEDWKCPDCWVQNKEEAERCACCSAKRPSKATAAPAKSKCSICKLADSQSDTDKCVNCEKMQIKHSVALPIPMPADPSKWKCAECWVSNEGSAEKCACCGSKNPKPAQPAAKPVSEKVWECVECCTKNKSSERECVGCGTSKSGDSIPKSLDSSSPFARVPDQKLAEITKAQKERWECTICLVRNESNISLCICCGSERPGATKKLSMATSFGTTSASTFKFGIDPKIQESKLKSKKDEEVKTAQPSKKPDETDSSKLVTFTFGIPKKTAEPASTAPAKEATPVVSQAPATMPTFPVQSEKPSFVFGLTPSAVPTPVLSPAPTPAVVPTAAPTLVPSPLFTPTMTPAPESTPAPPPTPAPSFGTGIAVSKPEEKPQEVPIVNVKAPEQSDHQLPGYFAPPQKSQSEAAPASALPTFSSFTSLPQATENKEPLKFTFGSSTVSADASKPKQSMFSFNAAPSASVPMFGAQTAVTASPAAPTTTAASTMMQDDVNLEQPAQTTSIFSTNSIFNANSVLGAATAAAPNQAQPSTPAPAPNAAAASAPAAAPSLFSFGSNAQTQPAEKPKFNFSFGKSETSAEPAVFGLPGGTSTPFPKMNNLGGGNGGLTHGNGPENTMGGNGLLASTMPPAAQLGDSNRMMFGSQPTGDVWNANTSSSIFGGAAQKPAPFTFGTPNVFSTPQPQPQAPLFGGQQPQAETLQQPATNMFSSENMFSGTPAPAFGSPQQSSMFGANQTITSPFETMSQPQPQPPQPAPFSFGASQPSSSVFGFGAQAQPQAQQPQQPGVYNFGGVNTGMGQPGMGQPGMGQPGMGQPGMGQPGMGQPGMGQPGMGMNVQFNMGSAPTTTVRRVRKAVRRNPQR